MHNIKFNQLCLATLTLAMCVQRLTIAVGNILYALSIVFFAIDTYRRHRAGGADFRAGTGQAVFPGVSLLCFGRSAVRCLQPGAGVFFPEVRGLFCRAVPRAGHAAFSQDRRGSDQEGVALPDRLLGRGWSGDAWRAAHHAGGAGTWARRRLAAPCEHRCYGVSSQYHFVAFAESGHPA